MLRMVTLADVMKPFLANRIAKLAEILGFTAASDRVFRTVNPEGLTKQIDEEMGSELIALLNDVEDALSALGLRASIRSIRRAKEQIQEQCTITEFAKLADELQGRMVDELEGTLLLSIDSEASRFYTDEFLFGSEVATNFPSASFDIEEAGKCLALERGTACVFHLMRVLEIGLYAVAAEFNIKPEENWGNAIEQIQSAIARLVKLQVQTTSPWKQAWKDRVEFYSEVATQFMYVKSAWRNRTAHVGAVYTQEKAESIFSHVREFMRHLATRLKEQG